VPNRSPRRPRNDGVSGAVASHLSESGGLRAAAAPAACLELSVATTQHLFNALDPAPFRERDLDPAAEDYIVGWAREQPRSAPLRLLVRLTKETPAADTGPMLEEAIDGYFRERAGAVRRELRQLLRIGRISLVIGLAFLALAIGVGEFAASLASSDSYRSIIKESFVIGGWVALWRPLEIFLYDWWPVRAKASMFDRLSSIPVSVASEAASVSPPGRPKGEQGPERVARRVAS